MVFPCQDTVGYCLLLANFGKEATVEAIVGKFSQETLAEMIGTTRSRVSHFMNKFRKLGYIEYNGKLEIQNSLLNVVLYDKPESGPAAQARNRDSFPRSMSASDHQCRFQAADFCFPLDISPRCADSVTHRLSRDEARRVAANIAKLPRLLNRLKY
jgi:hypothetical protein